MKDFNAFFQGFLEKVNGDYLLIAVLLLCLFFLCKSFFKKKLLIITSSKLGKMRTTKRALCSVIQGICKLQNEISHVHVILRVKHGKININLKLRLRMCINLTDFTINLQNRLNSVLIHDLGLSNVGRINITISGFSDYENLSCNTFISECACSKQEDQD